MADCIRSVAVRSGRAGPKGEMKIEPLDRASTLSPIGFHKCIPSGHLNAIRVITCLCFSDTVAYATTRAEVAPFRLVALMAV